MKITILIAFIFGVLLFNSCKESLQGDINANLAPETYTVVDTIIRFGDNRLKTKIDIHWWGDDKDGYLSGYEFSLDNKNWEFTQKQDSTFLINIPEGSDTFNFSFYIRSIDNDGVADKTPAYIVFPVKNSPPNVEFVYSKTTPLRKPKATFPVLKFSWQGSDPDGNENLAHYEIFLNDTNNTALIVESVYNSIIIKSQNLIDNIVDCDVFQGTSLKLHDKVLQGLRLNDTNRLFIRSVDIVGETSQFDSSYKIFVIKPTSKILLVNAYSKNIELREDYYVNNLQNIGISNYEITRINEVIDNIYTELSPDNITQSMIFDLFDYLIWFGKDVGYSMSLAQRTTTNFFNNSGKLFMAVEISSSIDEQAGFLDFTPIDSLVSMPKGVNSFRIERDSILPHLQGWPLLKSSKYIASARPFYQDISSVALYDAKIVKTGTFGKKPWEGKSTVIAKKVFNGNTQFIISSLELHNLNGNNNIDSLFTKIFIDELGLN